MFGKIFKRGVGRSIKNHKAIDGLARGATTPSRTIMHAKPIAPTAKTLSMGPPPSQVVTRQLPTPAERAEYKRMMENYRRNMSAPQKLRPPDFPPPPPPPPPKGRGGFSGPPVVSFKRGPNGELIMDPNQSKDVLDYYKG